MIYKTTKIKSFLRKLTSIKVQLLILLFGIYSIFAIIRSPIWDYHKQQSHLSMLAYSFTKGQLSLSPYNLPPNDYVDFQARQFLHFGPLPSIILMPFAWQFGKEFPQGIIGLISLLVSFLAIFKISIKNNFSNGDSIWLALFFVFSTVLFGVGVVNISSYQVQALGTALVLLALSEYFHKKRYLLIGSFIAFAGMTRMTLFISIVFFLISTFSQKERVKNITYLLIPIIISTSILGFYNYKRFRSFFESGYNYHVTLKTYPMSENIKNGMFNIQNLPTNLYIMLVKSPDPILKEGGGFILKFPYLKADPWGMAIWFTSPLFFFLIKTKKVIYSYPILITTFLIILPSLLYFGIGFSQFGYRYSLDFLPFLFLILIPALQPKLNWSAKSLIVIGVLFNCIYLSSLWGIYPHLHIMTDIR